MVFDNLFGATRNRKSFGKKEREALFDSQGSRCMYCGKKSPKPPILLLIIKHLSLGMGVIHAQTCNCCVPHVTHARVP